VTAIEVLNIEEAGSDYVRLRDGVQDVRINFADDEAFSKEERTGAAPPTSFLSRAFKAGQSTCLHRQ
jgi:hypothetical protein